MQKISKYEDIQKILEGNLPRVIYLPERLARRVGHYVYISLLSHGRIQYKKRRLNDAETSKLELPLEDFLLSLTSYAKEAENYIKLRGEYLTIEDLVPQFKSMGYTPYKVKRYMKVLLEKGYIAEVTDGNGTRYKFTEKTILPEIPSEKFKVIAVKEK